MLDECISYRKPLLDRMATLRNALRLTLSMEQKAPSYLSPVLRAFVLGYASSTLPQLLTIVITFWSKRRKALESGSNYDVVDALKRVFSISLEWNRFPAFCAALAGSSAVLAVCTHQVVVVVKSYLSLATVPI